MPDLVQIHRAPFISRAIDNTALEQYMSCPRKYYYSMVQHWRRGGLTKPALAYGTTWHSIMETHYRTGGDIRAITDAAAASWQQHDNPDDHRTLDRCISAYAAWLNKYGDHDKETREWGKTVGYPDAPVVENVAELWWEGMLHPYTGKIDRIFEKDGAFFVEDHKTSSQLGDNYFKQFDPSNQMMGYAVLAQKLTGLPIAGVRINAHGVLKTMNKFERKTILYSQERLHEWEDNVNVWLRRLNESGERMSWTGDEPARALLAFPHNYNACAGKYGQCTYTEICTYPQRLRQRMLESPESGFSQLPWDPMADSDEVGGEA